MLALDPNPPGASLLMTPLSSMRETAWLGLMEVEEGRGDLQDQVQVSKTVEINITINPVQGTRLAFFTLAFFIHIAPFSYQLTFYSDS
jgi:hypothetical protein